MKKILLSFLILMPAYIAAKTSVTFDLPDYFPNLDSQAGIAESFQNKIDANGDFIAEANMLSNISGYPVGSVLIGVFPHFTAGAGAALGFSNLKYFDDKAVDGSFPAVGFSPVVFFGTGISDKVDIIGKFSYFDIFYYNPDSINKVSEYVKIRKFKMVGIGGKVRYKIFDEAVVVPFLLKLEGINISAGADILRGVLEMRREIDGELGSFDLDPDGIGSASEGNYPVTYDGELDGSLKWFQISAGFNANAYFNIAKFINLYTGFGCAFGFGHFTLSADSSVGLTTDPIPVVNPTGELGTAEMESYSKYYPYPVIPTYVLGLEFNLFMFKLTAETMVNLKNKEDVTLTLGARFQF